MMAVKATLDAAGLQCSEVEADTSKQVFTGLQLDHKTGGLPASGGFDVVWSMLRVKNILLETKWPR